MQTMQRCIQLCTELLQQKDFWPFEILRLEVTVYKDIMNIYLYVYTYIFTYRDILDIYCISYDAAKINLDPTLKTRETC